MSFSPFTKQGILIGDVEFDLFSTLSRWVIVAFLSDLALRFFFKRRIGLYLVVQLSVLAGLRAWKANHQLHSPSMRAKRNTCFIFLAAFAMTRGIDLLLSSSLSILRRSQSYEFAFVSAVANYSSNDYMISLFGDPQMGPRISRLLVYQALRDITRNVDMNGTWPESIGYLSDAEVASVTLTDPDHCSEAPSNRPQPAPAVRINANKTTGRQLAMPHLLMLPLFGEGVHFAELFFDDPQQQSQQLAYGYTIPISTSYYIARDGRTAATGNTSRRHFGVISMPNNTLGAYDMECGLDMVGLCKWLLERLSQLGKGGGARLWFGDIYAQGQRGVTAATFTFSKNESSEVEVLCFGASSMDLIAVSTPKQLVRSSNRSDASVTTSFSIASENAVSAICLGRDGQVGTTDMLRKRLDHTPPRSTLRHNALFPTTQLCDIMFKDPILRNVTIAIQDSPKSTQICRTLVRRYGNITANTNTSDFRHCISARYSYLSDRSLTVTCMQSRTRPTLPLAMFSGRWGFISALTLQSSTIQTPVNNYGPQAWFASLVLVPWWLLLVVLAAGLILVASGGWGDLAEMVVTILYSFAFRRVPPAIAQRVHEEQQEPLQTYSALTSIALENIALNQHAQFALVQRQGSRQDGYRVGQEIIEGPLEISIVPNKWRVCKDDDISPTDTSKETVVEVAHSFSHLLSVARARQAANHGNAQV